MEYLPARAYDPAQLTPLQRAALPGKEPSLSGDNVIPVCEPDMGEREERYLMEAVRSGWVSSRGPHLTEFTTRFCQCVGGALGVPVNSGTSALMLVMAALNIRPGDEVIMPAFTMIATANAVAFLGATPVFVDCDRYYQMDPDATERAITSRTKAIIPVHIYGQAVDVTRFERIQQQTGIPVIYDAAEALGTLYMERELGGFGTAVCYSFYANKTISTGEGGMIVTADPELFQICSSLRDVGFTTGKHFWHRRLGYNFRMTNLAAAVGVGQTERFHDLVAARIDNATHYRKLAAARDLPGLTFQPQAWYGRSSHWMVGIEIDPAQFGATRDELRDYLASVGIETRNYFTPLHLQPIYYRPDTPELPQSERLGAVGLYLPSSSRLTPLSRTRVMDAIADFHQQRCHAHGSVQS